MADAPPVVTQRLPKHGRLEANRDDVIAALANNEPWSTIYPRYEVSKPALRAFVARHRDEIEALKASVRDRIQDVARRDKEVRIRDYDRMIDRIEALIEKRGGLEAVDYKGLGQGENYEIREVRRFDAPMVQQWLNLHDQIAKELGELPRPADVQVNIDNRSIVLQWETKA